MPPTPRERLQYIATHTTLFVTIFTDDLRSVLGTVRLAGGTEAVEKTVHGAFSRLRLSAEAPTHIVTVRTVDLRALLAAPFDETREITPAEHELALRTRAWAAFLEAERVKGMCAAWVAEYCRWAASPDDLPGGERVRERAEDATQTFAAWFDSTFVNIEKKEG